MLRGDGRFVGDVTEAGEVSLVIVRSPLACGAITRLDTGAAKTMPGVLAVWTGDDLQADGIGSLKPRLRHPSPDGNDMFIPDYYPLSRGRVRYVGDPVAVVVAETSHQALDAAEQIDLEIDPAAAVADPLSALQDGAPVVWDEVPGNAAFVFEKGDAAAVEAALQSADHVIERRLPISRVIAASIETRGALGAYDEQEGGFILRVGTQSPHRIAAGVAALMGVETEQVRVIAGDTGGSFGMKNAAFPEYALVLWAAKKTARPVRWITTRLESFLADSHAREQVADVALGLDKEGHFLGLRVRSVANIGAYLGPASTHPMVANVGGLAGVYRTPALFVQVTGIHCHTQNVSTYRGAGRPEATFIIERMADLAAQHLGLDRAEIRRRNLIQPDDMPFKTGLTFTYDSGNFPKVMEMALQEADWQGFDGRREESRRRGKLRGIGISNPIEIAGGPSGTPNPEFAKIDLAADGSVRVYAGSGDAGQGLATAYRQILSDRLGLTPDQVTIIAGDTGQVAKGTGTFGSRTLSAAGTSLCRAADEIAEAATPEAARVLESDLDDIDFDHGIFAVAGTNRFISLTDLARQLEMEFSAESFSSADNATFPNGCHICEIEIDPETGGTEIVNYVVADDVGTMLNPLLVKGQIQGGVAQGLGQAFMEQIVYEPDTAQLLTASFMDYPLPRSRDIPSMTIKSCPAPTESNLLGVKGAGEAGVVGALPAAISAVSHALAPLGVHHIDMPATPEKIWRAIDRASHRKN